MPAAQPRPATPDERAAAFDLLFSDLSIAERRRRAAVAEELVTSGELNPEGILVLEERRQLVGVCICQPLPGAGALIWPARAIDGPQRQSREDCLVRLARTWLRSRGSRMAQCLLLSEEAYLADSLARNGFHHLGQLLYLRRDLSRGAPRLRSRRQLSFLPYEQTMAAFQQTLSRTYEGTLDCPEVNGVRTLEEVLIGHRSQGEVRPGHWQLALRNGEPAGVLLLVALADSCAWELVYTGLVPEFRGQGLGRELVGEAMRLASSGGAKWLNLSVDGRNLPARSLYEILKFEEIERRAIYLAIWDRAIDGA